jgi:hypothetical protein
VQRQRRGLYRFSGHNYWVQEYAAKNNEGRWVFRARLADFNLDELPVYNN